jgi:hypothetical protein
MPDKAEPPSGKKPSKRPETICRMALTLIRPTTPPDLRRPNKEEPPSGKKNIKKAGNINVFPAFDLNGI